MGYADVVAAVERTAGRIRPVALTPADLVRLTGSGDASEGAAREVTDGPPRLHLALEFLQHTGSFKARGAVNFIRAHLEGGTLPEVGLTIASGGNAGLACAWAAGLHGVSATVFLPATAPPVKVARLRSYGATVRLVGSEYAEALAACQDFAAASGALTSHAYDNPLIAAGAGTLMEEIHARLAGLDTVVVSVGGGGLFAGVAAAAREHGVRVVAVEPANCRALNAALEAGRVVDVSVDSVAADSLGARRASAMALAAAQQPGATSVLVPDEAIVLARQRLWDEHRVAVEHGAATALAALLTPGLSGSGEVRGYCPEAGERVCVVLCGANTDPSDLA